MCIHCYRAHDWLSLMAICHASDGVPKLFRRQRSSFKTSRTRILPGISGRRLSKGTTDPAHHIPTNPHHPPLARPHISGVKPIVEIWQQLLCSPDGFQPESVKRVAPAARFRYAPWSHYINVLQRRDFLSLVVLNLEGQRHRIASDQLLVHLLKIFQQDDVSLSLLLT